MTHFRRLKTRSSGSCRPTAGAMDTAATEHDCAPPSLTSAAVKTVQQNCRRLPNELQWETAGFLRRQHMGGGTATAVVVQRRKMLLFLAGPFGVYLRHRWLTIMKNMAASNNEPTPDHAFASILSLISPCGVCDKTIFFGAQCCSRCKLLCHRSCLATARTRVCNQLVAEDGLEAREGIWLSNEEFLRLQRDRRSSPLSINASSESKDSSPIVGSYYEQLGYYYLKEHRETRFAGCIVLPPHLVEEILETVDKKGSRYLALLDLMCRDIIARRSVPSSRAGSSSGSGGGTPFPLSEDGSPKTKGSVPGKGSKEKAKLSANKKKGTAVVRGKHPQQVLEFSAEDMELRVKCRTSEGTIVEAPYHLLKAQSGTFFAMAECCKIEGKIVESFEFSLNGIKKECFVSLLEWMHAHEGQQEQAVQEDSVTGERIRFEFSEYERAFFNVDFETLKGYFLAADFLDMYRLYHFCAQECARCIMDGKSLKQIREMLCLFNDMIWKEKAKVCADYRIDMPDEELPLPLSGQPSTSGGGNH